ncbi:MAG: hypothetical protein FWF81_06155 [Defluviitaleaceae bacterium]|nr:hypothetical protein [Defluviitaleaceae bacterium]
MTGILDKIVNAVDKGVATVSGRVNKESSMNTFCANCEQELTGSEGDFCPECGSKIDVAEILPPSATETSVSLPQNKSVLLICAVVAAIAIVALVVSFSGGDAFRGTWEEPGSGDWITRIEFNRNGRGRSFDINANTSMTRNELDFRWETHEGMINLLVMDIVDPENPTRSEIYVVEFSLFTNAIGNEILRMRDAGQRWGDGWDSELRRVR